MAGYSELAGSIGKLLRLLADTIEKGQKHEREQEFQDQWQAIEADPIGWMLNHFSMSEPVPSDARQTGKTKPKPRSIKFDKQDTERLAKYILQLEWGYK